MDRSGNDHLQPELYFLIQKFLAASPLNETYKILCNEISANKILPYRLDWEGSRHERSFEDLERLYPHVGPDHLLQICNRIGPILDKEIPPSLPGVASLLGAGRQSLLRTDKSVVQRKSALLYATRRHQMPITANVFTTHNIVNVLFGRELSGPCTKNLMFPCERYGQILLHRQTLGHLSSVYCLLFDNSGRYIATGADDLLIKIWCSTTGRLLASFRGASSEITDIDINMENTMIAAGSIDRTLRIWNLQTGAPMATLICHTGMITSVNFCPSPAFDMRYLVTTSTDGSVAFWSYTDHPRNGIQFLSKPIQYQEKMRPGQAQMICSSFSRGGAFLAAGSADHNVRVYLMRSAGDDGPTRILETEVNTDRVDSISWAHRGLRFVSGSKDGTAHIWHFESQQWKNIRLDMSTKLPGDTGDEEDKKPSVTMVSWERSDMFVITAVSKNRLKVWRSATGVLERELNYHNDEIYVLEPHPIDPFIMLSAGHDGLLAVWNVLTGKQMINFENMVEGHGPGGIYDAKWSPTGNSFAASDSYGHILIFGFGQSNPRMKKLPKELFFHTDYRPLVTDPELGVLDEQTQRPPHLMPPPFLVDIDGNPYPPMLQRLVPGREHCTSEQLVPNIVVGTGGRQEVIEGLPDPSAPRSNIDLMIAALAQRQNGPHDPENAPRAASVRQGHRRSGDIEGVRQSTGEWQSSPFTWIKHCLVKPLCNSELDYAKDHNEFLCNLELDEYRSEMKRRPMMISTATPVVSARQDRDRRRRRNGGGTQAPRRNTRARQQEARIDEPVVEEEEEAEEESSSSSNEASVANQSEYSSQKASSESSDNETSGYSDWVADRGFNLEPPTRAKRKSARRISDSVDEDDENDEDYEGDSPDHGKNRRVRSSKKASAADSDASTDPDVAGPSKPRKPLPPKKNNPANRSVASKKYLANFKKGEIKEEYKPSEWLSETIARKAPYWPQIGDEVVYFVQGHKIYADAVKTKNIYVINPRELPWTKQNLPDHVFVKIVGIKYVIRPPRLCCLKLARLDDEGRLTKKVFTIKYHDMADVLDFIVLKQNYEIAVSRNWAVDDRFQCMIEDAWWMGKVVSKSALCDEYPDSLFSCYETQWDSGELERMSPWDMEPISDQRLPGTTGDPLTVLHEELQALLYQPAAEEWPNGDRDSACAEIITGLDYIMGLAIAEAFLAPVDLNIYPSYAYIIEYPIDLSTVKARLENRFYRRITSVQFDVRYLASNAEKYNNPHTVIVKSARIITELCLKLVKCCIDEADIDMPREYHHLMETYESSGTEDEKTKAKNSRYKRDSDDEDVDVESTTTTRTAATAKSGAGGSASRLNGTVTPIAGPSRSSAAPSSSRSLRSTRTQRNLRHTRNGVTASAIDNTRKSSNRSTDSSRYVNDWRIEARRLLDRLWDSEDSAPFRAPVDHIKHPDYLQMIDTPMDLGSIKEDLFGGNYETPAEFAKDMRLVFTNSKHYNTNNRSRIYSMTVRLAQKFEARFKEVMSVWRRSKRTSAKTKPARNVKKVRRKKTSTESNDDEDDEGEEGEEEEEDDDSVEEEHADEEGPVVDAAEALTSESEQEVHVDEVEKTAVGRNGEDDATVGVNNEETEDAELPAADEDTCRAIDPLEQHSYAAVRNDDDEVQQNGHSGVVNGRGSTMSPITGSGSEGSSKRSSSFSDSEKVPLGRAVSATSTTAKYTTNINDDDDEEDDDDSQPLSELRGRRNMPATAATVRRRPVKHLRSSNDDDDDYDDVDYIVERSRRSTTTHARRRVRPARKRARYDEEHTSDEANEPDSDDDDDSDGSASTTGRHRKAAATSTSSSRKQQGNNHSSRRKRCDSDSDSSSASSDSDDSSSDSSNSESDDGDSSDGLPLKRTALTTSASRPARRVAAAAAPSSNRAPRRTPAREYSERDNARNDNDDDDDDEEAEAEYAARGRRLNVSVSSRGRVRKMTERARGWLR